MLPYANVYEFWRKNCKDLPLLSNKAMKLLSIPATSANVERFFSKSNYIVRKHRKRLQDKNAENFFFIKGNSHLM